MFSRRFPGYGNVRINKGRFRIPGAGLSGLTETSASSCLQADPRPKGQTTAPPQLFDQRAFVALSVRAIEWGENTASGEGGDKFCGEACVSGDFVCDAAALIRLAFVATPPLTPPRKGEGDDGGTALLVPPSLRGRG